MSVMRRNRLLARLAAKLGGYFWMPCPSCRRAFGGQEWADVDGHSSSIPDEIRRHPVTGVISSVHGKGICPDCTAAGVGCRAHFAARIRTHVDCEFLPPLDDSTSESSR